MQGGEEPRVGVATAEVTVRGSIRGFGFCLLGCFSFLWFFLVGVCFFIRLCGVQLRASFSKSRLHQKERLNRAKIDNRTKWVQKGIRNVMNQKKSKLGK